MATRQIHDIAIERQAKASIREARESLKTEADPVERQALEDLIARLEGSWIRTETIGSDGALTEEQGIARDLDLAKEEQRQAIRDELNTNDLKILRAVIEGDSKRIAEHNAAQEALREKLRAI